jgi:hypothetical protein
MSKETIMNIVFYFDKWCLFVTGKKYDRWCETQEENRSEQKFAEKHMDPIYWCWNCKYSDCGIHNNLDDVDSD